jgi:hypothetical protein
VLVASDERALWSLAVRGELQRLALRCAALWGDRALDLDRIVLPDSAVAIAARELCQRVSSPALLGHCVRTYIWGALLAQRTEQDFDSELLFVASLLHDLGLTSHAAPSVHTPCFAVSGARAALDFLHSQGVAAERALSAAECITLHMNPWVPKQHSPEAQLMAAGAALDAIGSRKHELAPALREAVLQRYPYAGFSSELQCCVQAQIQAFPSTRTAFLERNFGFLKRIARAQLVHAAK